MKADGSSSATSSLRPRGRELGAIAAGSVLLEVIGLALGAEFSPVRALRVSGFVFLFLLAISWVVEASSRGLVGFYLREGRDRRLAPLLFATALLTGPANRLLRLLTEGTSLEALLTAPTSGWAISVIAAGVLTTLLRAWLGFRGRLDPPRFGRSLALALLAVVGLCTWLNLDFYARQYPIAQLLVASLAVISAGSVALAASPRVLASKPAVCVALSALMGTWVLPHSELRLDSGFSPSARIERALRNTFFASRDDSTDSDDLDLSIIEGRWGRVRSHRRDEFLRVCERPAPDKLILITIDTLRARNVHHLGHDRETTPFLDELAEECAVFERAYAQASHSLPSILSIFTGRYPLCLNSTRRHHGTRPAVEEFTLAETLSGYGYRTVGIPAFKAESIRGKFGEFSRGFEEYARPPGGEDLPPAATVTRFALDQLGRHRDDKLFMWMHFMDVHGPYGHVEPRYGGGVRNLYDAALFEVDRALSSFWRTARNDGLLDDALVIVHSDHGEEFNEHGGRYHGTTVYEEAIHVPLMLWMAKAPARTIASPVELVDLVPTALDVLGLDPPAPLHGDSLLPLWLGSPQEGIVLSQVFGGGAFVDDLNALVEPRFKLIAPVAGGPGVIFDLEENPKEIAALVEEPDPEVARRLSSRLAAARRIAAEPPPRSNADSEATTPVAGAVTRPSTPEEIKRGLGSRNTTAATRALDAAFEIGIDRFTPELAGLLGSDGSAGDAPELHADLCRRLGSSPLSVPIRDAIRSALDRETRAGFKLRLLDLFRTGARPKDRDWFVGWAARQPATLGPALLLCAAELDLPGARTRLLEQVPRGDDRLFLSAARLFAGEPDSALRHALIAAACTEPTSKTLNGIVAGLITEVEDPSAWSLLHSMAKRAESFDTGFELMMIANLASLPRSDAASRLAALIYRHGSTLVRARAVDYLARNGAPHRALDESIRDLPPFPWDSLALRVRRGSIAVRSGGSGKPLVSIRLDCSGIEADARSRFAGPVTVEVVSKPTDEPRRARGYLFVEPDGTGVVGANLGCNPGDRIRLLDPDGRLRLETTWPPELDD